MNAKPDIEALERMLTRLKLTAIRDGLDRLLDEAARSELTLRECLAFLCEAEVARKDERLVDDNHLGRLTTTILAGRALPPGALG